MPLNNRQRNMILNLVINLLRVVWKKLKARSQISNEEKNSE